MECSDLILFIPQKELNYSNEPKVIKIHQVINWVIIKKKKFKKINFLITILAKSISPENCDHYKRLRGQVEE